MKKINILHLYPNEMNIYGDRGNLLTLMRRIEWHGFEPVVHFHHAKNTLPKNIDIVLGGGGQDSAQSDIQDDILMIGDELHKLADAGVPMLMICGMYQLFCHKFITNTGEEIKGIGIFDAETRASSQRMVGNLKVNSEFGILYGFENHSGRTFLNQGQNALGKVLRGNGNNGQDGTEGAQTNNVFGAYLHGPMLPNNPRFTDGLIATAASNLFGEFKLKPISDHYAYAARETAKKRKY
ncbi:MAG TPA: glutamine amidotransferase [Candidatus Saccharimonadales bacterium]|nr:glutamine amidotransferase [Candidatus Saccharimonadales bacterium]